MTFKINTGTRHTHLLAHAVLAPSEAWPVDLENKHADTHNVTVTVYTVTCIQVCLRLQVCDTLITTNKTFYLSRINIGESNIDLRI